MTAGNLITEMKKLLHQFNSENEVGIERIEVECVEGEKTLDGKINFEYHFHIQFMK